jgi:hypothetical protein
MTKESHTMNANLAAKEELKKAYQVIQAEADKASDISDQTKYALEHFDNARASHYLNISASHIHMALLEYEKAHLTPDNHNYLRMEPDAPECQCYSCRAEAFESSFI